MVIHKEGSAEIQLSAESKLIRKLQGKKKFHVHKCIGLAMHPRHLSARLDVDGLVGRLIRMKHMEFRRQTQEAYSTVTIIILTVTFVL